MSSDGDEDDLALVAAIAASKQLATPVSAPPVAAVPAIDASKSSNDVVNSIVCQDCQKMLRTDQDCQSHAARTGILVLACVTSVILIPLCVLPPLVP